MKNIKIYITPGCQACEATMRWLDKKKIKYKRIVVYPNTPEETFLRKNVGHFFVPIVVVDDRILDPQKLWLDKLEEEIS